MRNNRQVSCSQDLAAGRWAWVAWEATVEGNDRFSRRWETGEEVVSGPVASAVEVLVLPDVSRLHLVEGVLVDSEALARETFSRCHPVEGSLDRLSKACL